MNTWKILHGDVRDRLRELPDGSVQTCVTSPPYWGLRDYGTAKWDGGDPSCDHTGVARRCDKPGRNDKQSTQKGSSSDRVSRICLHCGATRIDNQIGLEQTPEAFVAALVEVFREVRRVLAEDGTVWLNLGDSYATNRNDHDWLKSGASAKRGWHGGPDLKCKDLCGIPWRVAFALQADGWYLRSDIIWSKPNPMPESVTDRPTKSHEYIFLLSKAARYYYDAAAISEPFAPDSSDRYRYENDGRGFIPTKDTRNKRSVWHIATQPYPEAHFATFPEALIEPCILAGSKPGQTVLDQFNGSGTTGVVALKRGRNYIGIELNGDYVQLARKRIGAVSPLFAEELSA